MCRVCVCISSGCLMVRVAGLHSAGVCVLMCQSSRKEFYKKFLYEPLPVEVRISAPGVTECSSSLPLLPSHPTCPLSSLSSPLLLSPLLSSLTWTTSSTTTSTRR